VSYFRVWCDYDGDRPETPNVDATNEFQAAEEWVKQHHADLDYPAEVIVRVDDMQGHQFELRVVARRELTFHAGPVDT